ncbi:MAG TPA: 3-oxoacyl-ACP reductase, partial [Pusillimonas sp.]|nr:3-oxoacyl-ACP reductase [Pusillimonas sp.]
MDLGISGKSALVLGGSQGLGLACAKALAQAGVHVAINGRDAAKAQEAATQLGGSAIAVPGDIASPEKRLGIFNATRE